MPNTEVCFICLDAKREDVTNDEVQVPNCSHGSMTCRDCRTSWISINPSCPICRIPFINNYTTLTYKYRQLCESRSYVPRTNETRILQLLESHIHHHGHAYVHFTYIPVPLHVIKITLNQLADIQLAFYKDYECVLVKSQGEYYNKCQSTHSSFDFWAHSIIDLYTALPVWTGMPQPGS
jgi:hypothetical protein